MEFEYSAAQAQLRATARAFADSELRPHAAAREAEHQIAPATMAKVAALGLMGVSVPRALGGMEAGPVAYVLALRELARGDAAVAVTMAVTNMVAEAICKFGTTAQREKYVPKLVGGAYFAGAFALSEPGAGSDAASLRTRAEKHGKVWRLNGQKMWISHGDQAGVIVVWARTGDAGPKGISCFLVEKGTPGLSYGKPEEKMGLRASHTVALSLQDLEVPEANVLGELGQGFRIAMTALDGGRIGIGAQASGLGAQALALAKAYVKQQGWHEDVQQHQGPGFALADMATRLDAAWLLTLRAASLKEQGQPFTREAAMAKLYASEAANAVIRRAVQVMGHDGYMEEGGVARLFRDCRVTQLYEGTSEIQRLVISREVLKGIQIS